jgi:hypothetical protein
MVTVSPAKFEGRFWAEVENNRSLAAAPHHLRAVRNGLFSKGNGSIIADDWDGMCRRLKPAQQEK